MAHSCDRCHHYFSRKSNLDYHKENVKCNLTCFNCMTEFTRKDKFDHHYENIDCKKVHRCKQCNQDFKTPGKLTKHMKLHENENKNEQHANIINNINYNQCNISNDNKNINNIKIKVPRRKRNPDFFDDNPRDHNLRYDISHISKEQMDGYRMSNTHITDELLEYYFNNDQYEQVTIDHDPDTAKKIIFALEKQKLETEGFRLFFREIMTKEINRNARIRKQKSGEIYVYDNKWIKKKLTKVIDQICTKLHRQLYEEMTELSQFIGLVLMTQRKRYSEMRQAIEQEIIKLNV
jgi:hypothetical protein